MPLHAIVAISGHRSPSPFRHASPVVTIPILVACVASVVVAKRRWRRQYEDWRQSEEASNADSGATSPGPRYGHTRRNSPVFAAFALLWVGGSALITITHGASPSLLVATLPIAVCGYFSFRYLQSQWRSSRSG
jgi:hypothetical protein